MTRELGQRSAVIGHNRAVTEKGEIEETRIEELDRIRRAAQG
jgi:hypothetical protein